MKDKPISIFISYHHSDEEFKNTLKRHLNVLTLTKRIDIFDDTTISPGEEWDLKIRSEIKKADIIVMLISASFLSSNYIREVEIQLALKENKFIIPIIVRPAMWWEVDELNHYQVFPRDGKSISESPYQDEVFVEATREIKKIVDSINNSRYEIERLKEDFATGGIEKRSLDYEAEEDIEESFRDRPLVFISHSHDDGDFAELLKIKLESNGFRAWIDIDRLKIGEVWRDKIDEGIKESVALIVIMTEQARVSEYVTYEWAFGLGIGIAVLPLKLKETPFHPRLDPLQYLDFTNREARPWQKLLDRLAEVAKEKKT